MFRLFRKQSEHADLFLHFPCFDGLVSAVLASKYLESKSRTEWRVHPVSYEQKSSWLACSLPQRSAVVDFLFHPQATFWVDHHKTTFLSEDLRRSAAQHPAFSTWVYDETSPACASLIWNVFFHDRLGLNEPRLLEMVLWALKIDSASYESVSEALFGDAPALRINKSLNIRADLSYCRYLFSELREKSLNEVSESKEVSSRFFQAVATDKCGLEKVQRGIIMFRDIAVGEVSTEGESINRYSPYYFFPEARYSLMIVRGKDETKITAMRNPWMNFRSVNLGLLFERWGGGGHERVASLVDKPGQSYDELLNDFLSETQRGEEPAVAAAARAAIAH
jgi:hypothetical protein